MPCLRKRYTVVLLMLAGCAGTPPVPAPKLASAPAPQASPAPQAVAPPVDLALALPPVLPTPAPPRRVGVDPPAATASPVAAGRVPPVRAAAAEGAQSARQSSPAAVPVAPPVAESKRAEPTLDIASLQQRLRDTDAIGLFTKLALKNQVDALMAQFRGHYKGTRKTSLTELRQPYDLLVLKVLALLQDEDPPLAKMILGSREAMWDILADREKFNAVI